MSRKPSKDYNVGTCYKLNNNTTAEIVSYKNKTSVTIKIKETGSVLTCRSDNLKYGRVKDPLTPSVCGVGYIGYGEHSNTLFSDGLGSVTNPVHQLWVNMLNRCYGKTIRAWYKGVTVCDRWLCFQHFANDVQKLPGFDNWIRGERYELDKDTLKRGSKLVYSPTTCAFIKQLDNLKARKPRTK
ncbi:hypothetical protein ABEL47_01715 [Escherichia coli]